MNRVDMSATPRREVNKSRKSPPKHVVCRALECDKDRQSQFAFSPGPARRLALLLRQSDTSPFTFPPRMALAPHIIRS